MVFLTIMMLFYPAAQVLENPLRVALDNSLLLMLLFVALSIVGIVAQFQANRNWEIESYNRWEQMNAPA